ncbi:hypothetical protein FB566_2952 [Stackebrandtia endophytica]|uniref:Uncharacterized protein n=1 Tax=Stackebrandtia endophytica TaxID=1496996 RepID=A0A543AXW3_9ACTN|nr:hypothetical protein FB566_2952 [Stackebrandtia endophytica]
MSARSRNLIHTNGPQCHNRPIWSRTNDHQPDGVDTMTIDAAQPMAVSRDEWQTRRDRRHDEY